MVALEKKRGLSNVISVQCETHTKLFIVIFNSSSSSSSSKCSSSRRRSSSSTIYSTHFRQCDVTNNVSVKPLIDIFILFDVISFLGLCSPTKSRLINDLLYDAHVIDH